MGAFGEAFMAYTQPLIDETDGSATQVQNALTIGQLCYNLALMPEANRAKAIREMQPSLEMDDEEFDDFQRSVIVPMIRRHQVMFPQMHAIRASQSGPSTREPTNRSGERYPGTDRYAPCPCNSGEKYKFCCGKKRK